MKDSKKKIGRPAGSKNKISKSPFNSFPHFERHLAIAKIRDTELADIGDLI